MPGLRVILYVTQRGFPLLSSLYPVIMSCHCNVSTASSYLHLIPLLNPSFTSTLPILWHFPFYSMCCLSCVFVLLYFFSFYIFSLNIALLSHVRCPLPVLSCVLASTPLLPYAPVLPLHQAPLSFALSSNESNHF